LPGRPRGGWAAAQEAHPGVAAGHAPDDVAGAVRRAVVQDEQLEVGDTALGQQRRQGRTDTVRLVADR
jgi:hypothetical protein